MAGRPRTARRSLLDVRWRLGGPPGVDLYVAGHIPCAVFVDLDRDLAAPPGPGGRHPMPAAADFEAAMRRAGVSASRPVVVYDDADSTAAARAWWLLRYFGHPAVRVLDGGYRAWTAAGEPVSAGPPITGHARRLHRQPRPPGTARRRRRGRTGPHRPAARRPRGRALPRRDRARRPGGRPHPRRGQRPHRGQRLRRRHLPHGRRPGRPLRRPRRDRRPAAPEVGVYCGSGVTAAHEVLALTLAGIPAALYVGSWSNWITDPAHPIATGPV